MPVVGKILDDFMIDEISPVDRMAMEPAKMVLMKRDGTNNPEGAGDPPGEPVDKRVQLTTIVRGHQHLLDTTSLYDQRTSYDVAPDDEVGHSHPFVQNLDGSITIGMVGGHTHEPIEKDEITVVLSAEAAKRAFSAEERKKLADKGLALPDGSFPIVNTGDLKNAIRAFGRAGNKAAVARHIKRRARALGATDLLPDEGLLALRKADDGAGDGAGDDPADLDKEDKMPDEPNKAGDLDKAAKGDNGKEVADLKKKLARAEALASMGDAEKAFFKGLKEPDQEKFLGATPEQRSAEMGKAQDQNPVVYTTADGEVFRKNDDVRLVAMAQRADADRQLAKQERDQRIQLELEKRAKEEIPFLPGEMGTKTAMLAAIDKIEDPEVRKSALVSLQAQNHELALAFERKGIRPRAGSGGETAEDKLNKKAEELAKEKGISFDKAYSDLLDTPEGSELYKAYLEEHPAQTAPMTVG